MDYEPFKNLPDVKSKFMTERGSTYALFGDQTSQRNRSGEQHSDKTVGMQPKSVKTVFMDIDSLNRVGPAFQRDDWSTKFVPVFDENGDLIEQKEQVVTTYDLYPLKRIYSPYEGDCMMMKTDVPNDKAREFIVPFSMI